MLHPSPLAAVPLDSQSYYSTYGPMVLRRCRKLLGDEHAARDAMHDVKQLLWRPCLARSMPCFAMSLTTPR